MKEHLNIRGLTTAASIWMTAAIGIMIGIGFYFPAAIATVLTLGALALFPRLEAMVPTQRYAYLEVRTNGDGGDRLTLDELRALIGQHRCRGGDPSYALIEGGKFFRYQMTLRTRDIENFQRLAETLTKLKKTPEFELRPAGE
ncbi:MAG TPA: MgtC/SapB family protein, partial [Burkholderiales bacterium]|nr:MgtC/SapB family protein [Burkholderiales bacterium]